MKAFANNSRTISTNTLGNSARNVAWSDAHTELITKLEASYDIKSEAKTEIYEIRHYGFVIAGLNLLIEENLNCEVLEDRSIHPIPLLPNWVVGASNVRGDAVPIINLERFLTNKSRVLSAYNYRILIIGKEENAIGLLINNLPRPIYFETESLSNNFTKLPEELQPFVTFGYEKDQELWVNIDFASFFESSKT